MSTPELKAYEEKIISQLQQAKARLSEFEAHAKGHASQAEIDTINRLKSKHQEIEKKLPELRAAAEAKGVQLKTQIDAEVARFRSSLDDLSTKLKKAG